MCYVCRGQCLGKRFRGLAPSCGGLYPFYRRGNQGGAPCGPHGSVVPCTLPFRLLDSNPAHDGIANGWPELSRKGCFGHSPWGTVHYAWERWSGLYVDIRCRTAWDGKDESGRTGRMDGLQYPSGGLSARRDRGHLLVRCAYGRLVCRLFRWRCDIRR